MAMPRGPCISLLPDMLRRALLPVVVSSLLLPAAAHADGGVPGRIAHISSPDGTPMGVHETALRAHEGIKVHPRQVPDPDTLARARDKKVTRVSYGYYPSWVQDLTTIRWDSLTHIAWFAVEMNADGGVVATNGWPDTETVEAAHAADVRVDLAFTLFSGSGIKTLVNDPGRRAAAIATMIEQMKAGGADGISVDYEGFIEGTRDGFVALIQELRAELDAQGLSEAEISLAGPAVDWGGEWDLGKLLESADWFFIMGYDYFWSGSGYAGPSGILRVSDSWAHAASWAALRSIATYNQLIPPERRQQIIYGVPYYGRQWSTVSGNLGAATLASIGSVTYSAARADIDGGLERLWDDGARTPWYKWQAGGTWHQVYYDDEQSLAHKYQLANDQDLGGIGIWALNYDSGYDELWNVLEEKLGPQLEHPEGHRLAPIAVDSFPFHDERDTSSGTSQYFNFYACAPEVPEYGKELVYEIDVCQTGKLTATVAPAAGVDIDVHLLSSLDEAGCVARDDLTVEVQIEPGRYWVVADTYVDGAVEREGAYGLDIDFVADPGSEGCVAPLVCEAGTCGCGEGEVACGGECVDVQDDANHCGDCDTACDSGESCVQGQCQIGGTAGVGGSGAGAGGSGNGADEDGADLSASCSCGVVGGDASRPAPWAIGLLAVAATRLRRRRGARV
jgi:MYXO-CTERM domain-containing protein